MVSRQCPVVIDSLDDRLVPFGEPKWRKSIFLYSLQPWEASFLTTVGIRQARLRRHFLLLVCEYCFQWRHMMLL
jgi:hypothetical protein